jgi:hypothetical protein
MAAKKRKRHKNRKREHLRAQPEIFIVGSFALFAPFRGHPNNGFAFPAEVPFSRSILQAGFGYTSPPTIVIASPAFVLKVGIKVRRIEVSQEVVLGWKYVLETSTNNLEWTATGPAFVADSESLSTEFDVDAVGGFSG